MATIDPRAFLAHLKARGARAFYGVPDSLLKDLIEEVASDPDIEHLTCANEGQAVAMAAGRELATGQAAVVYLQNSGLGIVVNPVLSIADPLVYSIPVLLIIGWRGAPGVPDEPQHAKQGLVTLELLEAMGVPYEVLGGGTWRSQLDEVLDVMETQQRPVACVVPKGLFAAGRSKRSVPATDATLLREEALAALLDVVDPGDVLVSTTGKLSRELYELARAREVAPALFLNVGGMGHTSSVALGIAQGAPDARVWCLDGDGAMLMHMGGLAVVAQAKAPNLRYVVNVNGVHESVGSQPHIAGSLDLPSLLRSIGFASVLEASDAESIRTAVGAMEGLASSALVIRTRPGSRPDLGRPTETPLQMRAALEHVLREKGGTRP